MIEDTYSAQESAVLDTARHMCAAARTAPKTKGTDHIDTCIVTGEDKQALADEMDRLSEELGYAFFQRDARNVRNSAAVVVIGSAYGTRGLGEGCAYCRFEGCAACEDKDGVCVYDPLDLGIALGSAVSIAADARIDNRIMFSVGKAALSLGLLGPNIKIAMGIPLSAAGKSPFFDRK